MSPGIEVVSIVDRFLEHSRIFSFLNGGEQEIYLASADWMGRNLDKRIELMFPIEGAEHKARILDVLNVMFDDNVKARRLQADGTYDRKPRLGDQPAIRAQAVLQQQVQNTYLRAADRAGVVFVPQERQHER